MDVTTGQAGLLVGVSNETIRSWCAKDLVVYRRVGLKGTRYVDADSLREFATSVGYGFDDEKLADLTADQ